jgi:hypothetical protein
MNPRLLLLLLISFALFSCKNNPHAEKIKTLDSLYAEVLITEEILSQVDKEEAKNAMEDVLYKARLAGAIGTQAMDFESARKLGELRKLRKSFNNFIKNKEKMSEKIDISKTQLKTLSEDLKRNLISTDLANEYFANEVKMAVEMNLGYRSTIEFARVSLEYYRNNHAEVSDILDNYFQKHARGELKDEVY